MHISPSDGLQLPVDNNISNFSNMIIIFALDDSPAPVAFGMVVFILLRCLLLTAEVRSGRNRNNIVKVNERV